MTDSPQEDKPPSKVPLARDGGYRYITRQRQHAASLLRGLAVRPGNVPSLCLIYGLSGYYKRN